MAAAPATTGDAIEVPLMYWPVRLATRAISLHQRSVECVGVQFSPGDAFTARSSASGFHLFTEAVAFSPQ